MRSILLYALFILFTSGLFGQDLSLFDYLAMHDSVQVTIETDFKQLMKKKDEYQDAYLKITSGDSILLDTLGEIRSRGNIRKKVCYMPPTKIRLKKNYLRSRGFSTYPTLKIVNSCSFSNRDKIYVQKEQLIYQFNNLITDLSFRTKYITLTYIDTEGKRDTQHIHGFFIEHEDQLADRANGELYGLSYFKPESLNRLTYLRFCVFQYMIGNTDWKVLNQHNLVVIKVPDDRAIYPVAYDFDYAGLVGTHYAVPNSKLTIKSVRDRLYLGPCQNDVEIDLICQEFLSKKQEILEIVNNSLLGDRDKRHMIDYLDDFFEVLEDQRSAKHVFSNCMDY